MTVVAWNPFREFEDLFNRYNRVAGQNTVARNDDDARGIAFRPNADIAETENEYVVRAELAGISRDDVDVTVHDGVLTIKGERRYEKSADEEQAYRVESVYGRFARSFSLPQDVDEGGISATSRDGVLIVRLPKTEEKKPKSIEVKIH